MKLTRITVGKALTINLGDYSGVKPHFELEAQLEEGDNYQECKQKLVKMVDDHLTEELEKHSGD